MSECVSVVTDDVTDGVTILGFGTGRYFFKSVCAFLSVLVPYRIKKRSFLDVFFDVDFFCFRREQLDE